MSALESLTYERASRLATAAVLKTVEQRCLEGSTPSPSALEKMNDVSLAERQRCQPSKLARWVRLPQDTHWSEPARASVRLFGLKPDASAFRLRVATESDRGSSNGRIPDFESGDVRFESSSPNDA